MVWVTLGSVVVEDVVAATNDDVVEWIGDEGVVEYGLGVTEPELGGVTAEVVVEIIIVGCVLTTSAVVIVLPLCLLNRHYPPHSQEEHHQTYDPNSYCLW